MPLSFDIGPRINRVAISDELIARFKELIEKGVFVPGHRLPPERDLAEALAVSRPTLRQSMRALQIMGVIKARQGSGSYLADSAGEIMRVPVEFALAFKNVARTDLFETRRTLEVKLASLAATTWKQCVHRYARWRGQWAIQKPGAEANPSSTTVSSKRHAMA